MIEYAVLIALVAVLVMLAVPSVGNRVSERVLELYPRPEALWLIAPVMLYWITRIWFLAARNQLDDDPVVFALSDRISHLAALATGACILAAKL